MPAKILECTKVELHPNADSLRVYNFTDNIDNYQVIANSTNIYEVGDKVAVALIGSILKDDTEIKESKIRGILSQGMALGKSDLPIGLDVTNDYCHSEDLRIDGSNPQLVRWPSIDNLYNIRKNISEYDSLRKIKYRAKVKIHGCNSAIQIFPNGDIVTQSREQIITPEHDSNGFSRWVNENKIYWSNLKTDIQICIFGE
jgi:phenylalanyl-tRNA synthetase beta chain